MRVIRWSLVFVTVLLIVVDVLSRYQRLSVTAASSRSENYVLLTCGYGVCRLVCDTGVPDPPPGIKPGLSFFVDTPTPSSLGKGGYYWILAHPLSPARFGSMTIWALIYVRYPWLLPLCLTCVAYLPCVYRLLHRRHRIRTGHCALCGYSLIGNASGRCPECGEIASVMNVRIPMDRIGSTLPVRP